MIASVESFEFSNFKFVIYHCIENNYFRMEKLEKRKEEKLILQIQDHQINLLNQRKYVNTTIAHSASHINFWTNVINIYRNLKLWKCSIENRFYLSTWATRAHQLLIAFISDLIDFLSIHRAAQQMWCMRNLMNGLCKCFQFVLAVNMFLLLLLLNDWQLKL